MMTCNIYGLSFLLVDCCSIVYSNFLVYLCTFRIRECFWKMPYEGIAIGITVSVQRSRPRSPYRRHPTPPSSGPALAPLHRPWPRSGSTPTQRAVACDRRAVEESTEEVVVAARGEGGCGQLLMDWIKID